MAFTEQSIQKFVESYWSLPAPLAAVHRFQTQGYLRYIRDERGMRKINARLQSTHDEFLKQKFGKDVDIWLELCKADKRGSHYHLLYEHLYQTGMSEYAPVKTILRSRATLHSLLKILSYEERPFSILDLGCGDARIGIGVALAFEKLQKVYAVDCNSLAFQAMNRWIEQLPAHQREIARRKIVPINANYADSSFKERSDIQADVALLANLPTLSESLQAVIAFCPRKTCIAYFPSSPANLGPELAFEVNKVAHPRGLYFQFADEKKYWSNASVAAFRTF